jgi:hypothetical protein
MKKLCMLAFVLASFTTLRAQTITVNNNVWGNAFIVAYAYAQNSCGTFLDFATDMAPANTTGYNMNLNNNALWNLGAQPNVPYDIVYAEVSRDMSCPTWPGITSGSSPGACWSGGIEQYDILTVGENTNCGYNTHGCLSVMTVSPCNGFFSGDFVQVDFTPGGSNATIDLYW